jgi:hypothetical protein
MKLDLSDLASHTGYGNARTRFQFFLFFIFLIWVHFSLTYTSTPYCVFNIM